MMEMKWTMKMIMMNEMNNGNDNVDGNEANNDDENEANNGNNNDDENEVNNFILFYFFELNIRSLVLYC